MKFVMGARGGETERRGKAALARARREKAKKIKKAMREREERSIVPYDPNVTGPVRRSIKRKKGVTGTILPSGNVIMVANKKRIRSVVSGPNRLKTIQKRPKLETLISSVGRTLKSPVIALAGIPVRAVTSAVKSAVKSTKNKKVEEARARTERMRSAVKKNEAAALAARSARPVILRKLINNLGKEVSNISNLYTAVENKTSRNATNLKRRLTRVQRKHNATIKELANLERDMMIN